MALSFNSLKDGATGANIPADGPKTITPHRGDAKNDGNVDMSDALFIAQFRVGIRQPGIRPPEWKPGDPDFTNIVNGASAKLEATVTGEKYDMSDALFIAQYRVGLRDASFNWIAG